MRLRETCIHVVLFLKIISVESDQFCFPSSGNFTLPKDPGSHYPKVDSQTLRKNAQHTFGGKHVSSIKEFPYMVYLVRFVDASLKETNQWCGATILSPKHLLTAAHCLMNCSHYSMKANGKEYCVDTSCYEYDKTLFQIYAGSNVPKHAEGTATIERWTIHPKFKYIDFKNNCTLNFDIAVVELMTKFRFTDKISNIGLPPAVALSTANGIISTIGNKKHCEIIGWGYTSVKEPVPYLDRKLKVERANLIDSKTCVHHLKAANQTMTLYSDRGFCRLTDLCTLDPKNKKGVCGGDSGGPLVCDGVQVGVMSSGVNGYKCAGPHTVDIYAKVDINVEWITKIISRLELPMWLDFPSDKKTR